MSRILVIDDEPAILRAAQIALVANDFEVVVAATGRQGIAKFAATTIDVVLLDLGLPDMSGLDVLGQLRELDAHVPVIVLSAWEEVDTKIRALDRGADDYLEKPFNMGELLARIRVALRRRVAPGVIGETTSGDIVERGPIRLDRARRTVERTGEEVELTRTQFDLLQYLMLHPDRVLTHRAIAVAVWGSERDIDPANMRVVISQLRKRIDVGEGPSMIRTVLGIGYSFEPGREAQGSNA